MHPAITLEAVMEAVEATEYIGFCVDCGAQHDGIEPDARRYTCEECEAPKVYGAEELLLMMSS